VLRFTSSALTTRLLMTVVLEASRFTSVPLASSMLDASSTIWAVSSRSDCISRISWSTCCSRSTSVPLAFLAWIFSAYTFPAVCTEPFGRTWNRFFGLCAELLKTIGAFRSLCISIRIMSVAWSLSMCTVSSTTIFSAFVRSDEVPASSSNGAGILCGWEAPP